MPKTKLYRKWLDNEIPWANLPQTFQDAVDITRGLGIRYLWIDALCIIQGDDMDWKLESPRMAGVYSNAYLNIAATHSNGPSGGCHLERYKYDGGTLEDKSSIEPVAIDIISGDEAEVLLVRQAFSAAHAQVGGHWAFSISERFTTLGVSTGLSGKASFPENVALSFEELIVECRAGLRCECGESDALTVVSSANKAWECADSDALALTSTSANKAQERTRMKTQFADLSTPPTEFTAMTDLWLKISWTYSQLRLSYQSDRLPALSGIASYLSKRFSVTYLAGLW